MTDVENRESGWLKAPFSVPDILAVVTAGGVALTAVYHWGFFAELDPTLVSTLTVQEFLAGGLISIAPTGTALLVGVGLRLLSDKSKTAAEEDEKTHWQRLAWPEKAMPWNWFYSLPTHLALTGNLKGAVVLLGIATAFTTFLVSYRMDGTSADLVIFLTAIALALGWLGVAAATDANKYVLLVVILISLLYSSFVLGKMSFNSRIVESLRTTNYDAVVLESGQTYSGHVIAFTAANLLLSTRHGYTHIIPSSKIRIVRKAHQLEAYEWVR